MAEVGLVQLAKTALKISRSVLPARRSRFSKKQFSQPQLLALLCLMRFEDWTYREAEVRLGEHRELREALEFSEVPDHTTVYRFLRRLKEEDLTKALEAVVKRFPSLQRTPQYGGDRCNRLSSWCHQHFLCASPPSPQQEAHGLALLAKVAGGS